MAVFVKAVRGGKQKILTANRTSKIKNLTPAIPNNIRLTYMEAERKNKQQY